MRLHDLTNPAHRQSRKRVGRGTGSNGGKTAGRGTKGAGARSGNKRRAHFEGGQLPYLRRLPKRGFKNPNRVQHSVVNVARLEETFETDTHIDDDVLSKHGIIEKNAESIKVLGDGELTKAFHVKANKFSKTARAKIEASGGSCEII